MAGLLCEAGFGVQVFKPISNIPQGGRRPLRLAHKTVQSISQFLLRHGRPVDFLQNAPEVESWSTANGEVFPLSSLGFDNPDRWVDGSELSSELWDLAEYLGAILSKVEVLPQILLTDKSRVIVDVDPQLLAHWPSASNWKSEVNYRTESVEIWLPEGRISETYSTQFFQIEGAVAFLEPHPKKGFSLSFYAGSRYSLERAIHATRSARGNAPSMWRALLTLNQGACSHYETIRAGLTGIKIPGIYLIGAALGRYAPFSSLHGNESFEQVTRLCAQLSREVDSWMEAEVQRFRSQFKRAKMWEKLLISERSHRYVLSATHLMPGAVRRFLKSPF